MSELNQACQKMNQLLKESSEYRTYIFARDQIRSHAELYSAVQNFKKQYSDIEQYTEGNPYDALRRLYDENDELLHNEVVNEYLRAETDFTQLIQNILDRITSGLSL